MNELEQLDQAIEQAELEAFVLGRPMDQDAFNKMAEAAAKNDTLFSQETSEYGKVYIIALGKHVPFISVELDDGRAYFETATGWHESWATIDQVHALLFQ